LAVVAGVWFGLAARSGAQSADLLNERISSAREEARGLAAEVDGATATLAAARERAAGSRERESALSTLLASGREREAGLARSTAVAERRLRAARERLGRAVQVLSDRLVAIYKSGEPNAFELLLAADGFDDLVTRSDYLRRVEESDARLATRVRSLRDEVRTEAQVLRDARDAAAQLNARLASARRRIGGVRAESEEEARVAARARDSQASALASLRSNVAEWTREVERIEQVSTVDAEGEVISWFGDWAIPQAIVMCESGGNYSALNPSSGAGGAYQILPSTWKAYGGNGLPHQASKTQQDRIAALIWRDSGPSAWACAG
jgi:chromosome segregation ATPase